MNINVGTHTKKWSKFDKHNENEEYNFDHEHTNDEYSWPIGLQQHDNVVEIDHGIVDTIEFVKLLVI